MRKLFITLGCALLTSLSSVAQGYYTQYYADKELRSKAEAWVRSGEWRNGYDGAAPHSTVNAVDFYLQYQKNPSQWKALFQWLAKTDLLALPKGRHNIEGSNLVASIEDDTNGELSTKRSESHNHKIDFQFVVRGVEKFGIIDHYTSKPSSTYRPDIIHYDYDVTKAKFYLSNPKEFFLFFLRDWHIAKINNDLGDPEMKENIRVVVVKIDYVE